MASWLKIGNIQGPPPARLAMRLTTASDGTFAVAIPAGLFGAAPVVNATAEAPAGRDYVVTLTATSALAVSGRVRMARTLPSVASLTSLAGYDALTPAAGVIIHLTIQGAS